MIHRSKFPLTICDEFSIVSTGDKNEKIGIICFKYLSRITDQLIYAQIDTASEHLSHTIAPHRKSVLISLLSNCGFRVSTLPGALDEFLHFLLYPNNGSSNEGFGQIIEEELPPGAAIEKISTLYAEEEYPDKTRPTPNTKVDMDLPTFWQAGKNVDTPHGR